MKYWRLLGSLALMVFLLTRRGIGLASAAEAGSQCRTDGQRGRLGGWGILGPFHGW